MKEVHTLWKSFTVSASFKRRCLVAECPLLCLSGHRSTMASHDHDAQETAIAGVDVESGQREAGDSPGCGKA